MTQMTFWIVVGIALLIAGFLLMPSREPYYVRQANDGFGLFIGGAAIGAIIVHLFV